MLECGFESQLGLDLRALVYTWYFLKLIVRVFSGRAVSSYHVAHAMLHMISARCVARDLHMMLHVLLPCWEAPVFFPMVTVIS